MKFYEGFKIGLDGLRIRASAGGFSKSHFSGLDGVGSFRGDVV